MHCSVILVRAFYGDDVKTKQNKPSGPMATTLKSGFGLILIPIFWLFFKHGYVATQEQQIQKFPDPWPPIVGQAYPDLELIDQNGEKFSLSFLKGKVIIVEPIGMNCPSCQAFSGAHDYGAFENNSVEQYSASFRKIFPLYAKGLKLPSRDLVFVQLILYDMALKQPDANDAKAWAEHFRLSRDQNHFVAVSPYDLRGQASFNLIPGFQVIDRDFILRADSTGHHPTHDLYKQLIPYAGRLVAQSR